MIHTEHVIAVKDVEASSKWYQLLLECENTHQSGKVFDQLIDNDGKVLLCLHQWGNHNHPSLMDPNRGKIGNGLLLLFRINDLDEAWKRTQSLKMTIVEEPHLNPLAGHNEFTVCDLDGYYVTICSPYLGNH